ncbi:MAG: hypothetical protein ACON38_09910 [Akkermansiaceae bacterium]
MKKPKLHYPVIAAAALAVGGFIPASLGGEKVPAPVAAEAKKSNPSDPVLIKLNEELIAPLTLQSKRWEAFSRREPTSSTSYQLVEIDSTKLKGERLFKVVSISTPFVKEAKPSKRDYLKLRYLEDSGETMVDLKGEWVSPDKHPILKQLPKPEKNIAL